MNEIAELFKRQAEWQAARRHLSWPEKVRIAERLRATLLEFRRTRQAAMRSDSEGAVDCDNGRANGPPLQQSQRPVRS